MSLFLQATDYTDTDNGKHRKKVTYVPETQKYKHKKKLVP